MATIDLLHTPLYEAHMALGGRMVDFAGWAMPIQYQSILEEHRAVRSSAGMFDVSHMGRIEAVGSSVAPFFQWIIAGDVRKLFPGKGMYSVICNEDGGILDDVILYCLGQDHYYLVCNASNRAAVLEALRQAQYDFMETGFEDLTQRTGMIALQGPEAARRLGELGDDGPHLAAELAYFTAEPATIAGIDALVARTGYTGEDGFELIASAAGTRTLWERLAAQGVKPCGLGARDTLRLEAALPLHGHDISPETDPLSAGLAWTISMDKGPFVGYDGIARVKADGPERRLIGFEVTGRGIPRAGQTLLKDGQPVGEVTSGGPAPTLGKNIGLGYVPSALAAVGTELAVDIRGAVTPVRVVRRPFYRRQRPIAGASS